MLRQEVGGRAHEGIFSSREKRRTWRESLREREGERPRRKGGRERKKMSTVRGNERMRTSHKSLHYELLDKMERK